MIRFTFKLRALDKIVPWTDGSGNDPHLSWFSLADGWYWIEVFVLGRNSQLEMGAAKLDEVHRKPPRAVSELDCALYEDCRTRSRDRLR